MMRIFLLAIIISLMVPFVISAQESKTGDEGFKFTDEIILPVTSVKNQNRTGTCWAFSALSFFESEMLRLNKPEVDLSEMFVVYNTYSEKALKFVRLHGNLSFTGGGAFHDVCNVIRKYGIVPEEVYKGLNYGEDKHVHGEMDQGLKDIVDAIVKNPNRKLSPVWHETVISILNTYLGIIPERFDYQGNKYTPQSFARDFTGLNMDDYVEISSYSHHPFYTKFILEVPDNWSWDEVYNVPMPEIEEIIDNSLLKGYTVAWASDVSEKGFLTSNKGVAMVPVKKTGEMTDTEKQRWEKLSDKEKEEETYQLSPSVREMEITQELRQLAFDNYLTTDDHGMQIIGTAQDQTGRPFYKIKNSWGEYNSLNGFFYASKAFVNYKTTCIMVNKNAIPQHIRKKLDL